MFCFCYLNKNKIKCRCCYEQHRQISSINPSKTLRLLRTRIRNSPVSMGAEKSVKSPFPLPSSLSAPESFRTRGCAPNCARQQPVSFSSGRSPTQLLWFLSAGDCTDRSGAPSLSLQGYSPPMD
ncbi:hypothetical protein AMECASPLE_039224 [Ameca splendens]|uniref:Uncharacterized protein n=1 Tax=Ameca splendens TaxID=208324 RepID=A0ABV0ZIZ0_9TELE